MSSIQNGQAACQFQKVTPICGNCVHEMRKHTEIVNKTERTCKKNGWFVLLSGTCNKHEYRKGAPHVIAVS